MAFRSPRIRSLLAVAAALLASTSASARPGDFSIHDGLSRLPRGPVMLEGAPTLSPFGWSVFCARHPGDCAPAGAAAVVALDAARWAELQAVNRSVNARIAPRVEAAGQDDWQIHATAGDCEDYALQKRHELLARGWPSAALSLAVATLRDGTPHAVLLARTSQGDFVLDNMRGSIVPWTRAGYRFVKRQSDVNPRRWVSVGRPGEPREAPAIGPVVAEAGRAFPRLRGTISADATPVVSAGDWNWR